MPVDVRWADEEHSAVVIEPSGDWSWETFYEATSNSFRMFDDEVGNHKIHTVIDWSQTVNWPKNTLVHGRNLLTRTHARQGAFVFAGMNGVLTGLFRMFQQLNASALKNITVLTAKTVDEALERLADLEGSKA
ncbi:MAG: hypothetical protein K8I30_06505 [Anaerolineae bacterium]|nr:hypothetical protein [Anaerolineae bacterium]